MLRLFTAPKLGGDLFAFFTGVFLNGGNSDTIKPLLLQTFPGISQGAADEVVRGVVGLVLAVVSRWAFASIERGSQRRKERRQRAGVAKVKKMNGHNPDEAATPAQPVNANQEAASE